jgi:hypothetical protein
MDINEINKMLDQKDISPELRKSLEQRKEILLKNKVVLKIQEVPKEQRLTRNY